MKFFTNLTPNERVFGFIFYALQLLIIPSLLMVFNMLLGNPISEAMINFLYFIINFAAILLIFRKFLAANWKAALAEPKQVAIYSLLGIVIYFGGNFILGTLILLIDPDFANINDMALMEMMQNHFGIMMVGTVLLVPIAEECFYRGLFFRCFYGRSPAWAYSITMVLFSVVHVLGYIGLATWGEIGLSFLQYLPAGFALAWCYRRSGTIFTPVLVHTVVNLIGMLMMR